MGRRATRRFDTLRWRLMLSFFVAAWAAMMSLEGLFVVAPGLVAMYAPQRPISLAQGMEQRAPQLAPYLLTTSPDRSRLIAILATFKQPIRITEGLTDNIRGSVSVIPGDNASLSVVSLDGKTLAALPATNRAFSDLARVFSAPEARAVVAAALRHQTPTADMAQSTAAGQTVAAAPIISADGVTRGALLLAVDLEALARPIYLSSLLGLIPSALLFGVIASLFGAIFGLLTARGLTERLRRLTAAADAWSHGDFAATARDPSADELGQLARDLNRMAERLRNLLQDQQRLAVVEERNRLARDLHDSVKQQMFALTMLIGSAQLEIGERSEAQRVLKDAERIAGNAQQELTSLIHALRPVALTSKGLSEALREHCASWTERTGISCDLRVADTLALAPEAEQDIFHIVQEGLANIARHSGATRAEVYLERAPDALTLRIRDNGHGFDTAQTGKLGVGLRSMRERVDQMGGTLEISSSAGGTRIEARVPLSPAAESATANVEDVRVHEASPREETV
ncbi:MAG TPA: histidine kinase [Ktedonobacterales bacterium]|nr:histidine kinase [Ktedonobacterales bacterium]